jgi:hypothetical protein
MPTFLADPPQWIYYLLAAALVLTGAIAAQKQDRRAVIPFGIAFLLMMLVFLLDRFGESPREEAIRRTMTMGLAADAKNPDEFVKHVADKVEVQTGEGQTKTATREEMRKSHFWELLRQYKVQVTVDTFSREDVKEIDDNAVEIGFVAKGDTEGKRIPVYCRATFRKQSDGSYKLTAFKSYEYIDRTKVFPIPNFP